MTLPRRISDLERRLAPPTVDNAKWMWLAATYVLDSPILAPYLRALDGPLQTEEGMEALRKVSPELWDDPTQLAAVREMFETMQEVQRKF